MGKFPSAMSASLTGWVAGVYVGSDRDSLVTTPVQEAHVTLAGFVGDRHAGIAKKAGSREGMYARGTDIRNNRQFSAVSLEELAEIAVAIGVEELHPEWLGANLALRGIPDLTHLPPLSRLVFPGGAVLVVYGENKPCVKPARVIQEFLQTAFDLAELFPRVALGKRGIVGWVECPGIIRPGDEVVIRLP